MVLLHHPMQGRYIPPQCQNEDQPANHVDMSLAVVPRMCHKIRGHPALGTKTKDQMITDKEIKKP